MRNNGRAQRRRRVPPKKRGAHYVQNRCETRVNYENFITDDFNDWWVGWACYERGSWLALVTAKSMNEWALGREAHFRFDVVRRCDASLWKRKEITQPRSNHQVHFRLKRPFCLLKNLKKTNATCPSITIAWVICKSIYGICFAPAIPFLSTHLLNGNERLVLGRSVVTGSFFFKLCTTVTAVENKQTNKQKSGRRHICWVKLDVGRPRDLSGDKNPQP